MSEEPNWKPKSFVLVSKLNNNSNRFLYFLALILLFIVYFLSKTCIKPSYTRITNEPESNSKLKPSKFSKCLESNWNPRQTTHLHAPIRYLPNGEDIIISNLSNTSFCDSKQTNVRVLVIHSRNNSSQLRKAIRNSYADFTKYTKKSLNGNWTKLFLVGKPNCEEEKLKIAEENFEFGDIVVANVDEGYYYQLSLKYLIGLKFVSCFCSHADYYVKVDDDTYLRHFFLAL